MQKDSPVAPAPVKQLNLVPGSVLHRPAFGSRLEANSPITRIDARPRSFSADLTPPGLDPLVCKSIGNLTQRKHNVREIAGFQEFGHRSIWDAFCTRTQPRLSHPPWFSRVEELRHKKPTSGDHGTGLMVASTNSLKDWIGSCPRQTGNKLNRDGTHVPVTHSRKHTGADNCQTSSNE